MQKVSCLLLTLVLAGCAATGDNLRSNTYTAAEVNKAQNAEAIEIISVMDAKVVVDNSEQKRKAQIGGTTLGALAGGLGGGLAGLGAGRTAGTTVAGGAVGVAAGSMVSETVLVDGVTIGFRRGPGGQVMTSSQVGRKCEFQAGDGTSRFDRVAIRDPNPAQRHVPNGEVTCEPS